MEDSDDLRPEETSGKALNWVFALATALVACGIGWVGWNCIDSVQKNAHKLDNFHVTADNTKIDSQHLDILKDQIDDRVSMVQLSPSEDLQAALVKEEGSELLFSKGLAAMDKKQFAQAVQYYSQVLAMIPQEAKTKTSWYAQGAIADRCKYTMCAYRQRAICYKQKGDYALAVADLTAALKLEPENTVNYKKRAEVYYLLGKKALGDRDNKTMQELTMRHRGPRRVPPLSP